MLKICFDTDWRGALSYTIFIHIVNVAFVDSPGDSKEPKLPKSYVVSYRFPCCNDYLVASSVYSTYRLKAFPNSAGWSRASGQKQDADIRDKTKLELKSYMLLVLTNES